MEDFPVFHCHAATFDYWRLPQKSCWHSSEFGEETTTKERSDDLCMGACPTFVSPVLFVGINSKIAGTWLSIAPM